MANKKLHDDVEVLAEVMGDDEAQALVTYHLRREWLADEFEALGHGSQKRAAEDLGLTNSTVSAVLRGSYIRESVLSQLEAWVKRQD